MRVMFWFYWRIRFEACKRLVRVIFHGYINSLLILIQFQLNSTETFTIPINSYIVVLLNVLIRWSKKISKKIGDKVVDENTNIVGHVR